MVRQRMRTPDETTPGSGHFSLYGTGLKAPVGIRDDLHVPRPTITNVPAGYDAPSAVPSPRGNAVREARKKEGFAWFWVPAASVITAVKNVFVAEGFF